MAISLLVQAQEAKTNAAPSVIEKPGSAKVALGDVAKGKPIFEQNCIPCHGEAGRGDGPAAPAIIAAGATPRNFTDKAAMEKISNEEMVKGITLGGAAVGKSLLMAPWNSVLKEDQVKDVAAFVRTFAK
jgi:mono/diheme cytochrome c family protein